MAAHSHNSPLNSLVGEGCVASLRCAGHEVVRRIFVTVRDRNWLEIRPTHFNSVIDEARGTITLSARHTSDLVDFAWQGILEVSDDRHSLHFAIEGKALRDMEVCRLGLIVLHPVEPMIDAQIAATGPRGEQRITVTRKIAPQPIVNGVPGAMTEPFSELRIERADVGTLSLRFDGELFELEDQRNWGDASFKTYCTPLRHGFPRVVKVGTSIAHSVDMHFTPADRRAVRDRSQATVATAEALPAIGGIWQESPGAIPTESGWQHRHFDLATPKCTMRLGALLEASPREQIELAVETAEDGGPAPELLALLGTYHERITRILLYGPGTALPAAVAVERWRHEIDTLNAAHIPLFAATRGYYVEFNRSIPFNLPVSGIAFPLSATVHADDAGTILDNVSTIHDMVDTARELTHGAEVVIAPLALYYPQAPKPQQFPGGLCIPWLAATLTHAAAAGVTSITLAEDVLKAIQSPTGEHGLQLLSRLIGTNRVRKT